MAEITAEFLRVCRENIRDQGDIPELKQQSIGALRVLDQLIAHLELPEAPKFKENILGVTH